MERNPILVGGKDKFSWEKLAGCIDGLLVSLDARPENLVTFKDIAEAIRYALKISE